MPLCVAIGAALEYSMIHWHVGEVNFYSVYKRNEAHRIAVLLIKRETDEYEHSLLLQSQNLQKEQN